MRLAIACIAGYLLGSIPFGYLIAQLARGQDIRRAGSGNIGAANVSREIGAGAGALTLLLDAAKGSLAVYLAAWLLPGHVAWLVLAGLAAILGHLFPVWLGFRGGRGVATAAGVFALISWKAVLGALVVWAAVMLVWRYASLASIVAAASLPPLLFVLYGPGHAPPRSVTLGSTLASVLVIWRHRPNLQRLVAGTEPRFSLRR